MTLCARNTGMLKRLEHMCRKGEFLGRSFGNWKEADDPTRVFRKVKVEENWVTVDLAETFFGNLHPI